MDLRDYLRIVRRRWMLILAIVAACVGVAAVYTAQAVPQYASRARVFVSTTPDSSAEAYQGGLFSQQRVSSYADMMNGLELAGRVVDELQLDLTPEELSKKISATVVPDTVLLDVTVTDPSAAEAQRINQSVVDQLKSMVSDLETPPGSTTPLLKATVVDPPRLPKSAVSPRPVRNLGLALAIGLLLGFGVAVLREILDNSVKDPADVPGLEDVPLLAALPRDSIVAREPLVSSLPSHAPRAEAFRVLRTNLQFLSPDEDTRSFLFTSSVPQEGKTSTSTNLAITLAQTGKRVLLVDADLRRPRVAQLLGLESAVGLTTVLLGRGTLEDSIQQHVASGVHLLASGPIPPNPAEILQSRALADLLKRARDSFEYVIIDAPPLLPVTDAALLAAVADATLVVVRHSDTTREQLTGAVERLRSVDVEPHGFILNLIPQRRSAGYSYAGGYGYGYAPDEAVTEKTKHARRGQAVQR